MVKEMTKYILIIIVLCHLLFNLSMAFALNSKDVVRLKKAGVGDRLIKEVISSHAISRALISVEEIVEMKEARIGDEVILAIIREGSASVPELDREDIEDRALRRKMKRHQIIVEMQRKELDLLVEYLSRLITNPEVIKLVHDGKVASEDYARIVKYLKQYARGEETIEYDAQGDIIIDIDKTHK